MSRSSTTTVVDLMLGTMWKKSKQGSLDVFRCWMDTSSAVAGVGGVVWAKATRGSEEGLLYGVGFAGEQLNEDAPCAQLVDGYDVLGGTE
jgi:hypothetical protein